MEPGRSIEQPWEKNGRVGLESFSAPRVERGSTSSAWKQPQRCSHIAALPQQQLPDGSEHPLVATPSNAIDTNGKAPVPRSTYHTESTQAIQRRVIFFTRGIPTNSHPKDSRIATIGTIGQQLFATCNTKKKCASRFFTPRRPTTTNSSRDFDKIASDLQNPPSSCRRSCYIAG